MAWVKIDDNMPEHPKLVRVGPLGLALQVAALCYCNRQLTDGFIPAPIARRLLDWKPAEASTTIAAMVGAGVWDEANGGYLIHDYAEFQPTKAQVEEERSRKSAAGKAGAASRAQQKVNRRSTGDAPLLPEKRRNSDAPDPDPDPPLTPGSSEEANASSSIPSPRDRFLAATATHEAVGALIDFYREQGRPVAEGAGGRLGKLVNKHGHGLSFIEAAFGSLSAKGDPLDYLTKTLGNAGANGRENGHDGEVAWEDMPHEEWMAAFKDTSR